MELAQIEAFLVLAEELHFGKASQRLYVSQPMVSRRIVSLKREIGGALFERTSAVITNVRRVQTASALVNSVNYSAEFGSDRVVAPGLRRGQARSVMLTGCN